MLFNSIDFALFLPVVWVVYQLLYKSRIGQNRWLLLASYVFYGWWDYRFLALIFLSTLVDYAVGLQLAKQRNTANKKRWLWLSIAVNIGMLGFFKYFNFFVDNFTAAFSFFGSEINAGTLIIVLPVGISFYTFQTLSYTLDVYNNKLKPTRNFTAFAAFVSFFPQLVAGPIERAKNLLPRFFESRPFNYRQAKSGMRQILWGLFKKMVIADNCGVYADMIFDNPDQYGGATLFLGAVFFAFQIYGDFSGYSDVAIGTAKLFGFRLMDNFKVPYFSRDIAEFWRRWHISLSTWFRDYVYIPLGGSRTGKPKVIRNVFIVFLVSGFWHGADWSFILWGGFHAVLFLPLQLSGSNRRNLKTAALGRLLPSAREYFSILLTFFLTTVGWVFFRAESASASFAYLKSMFIGFFDVETFVQSATFLQNKTGVVLPVLIIMMLAMEWWSRAGTYGLEVAALKLPTALRWLLYAALVFIILMFQVTTQTPFIYFQF